MCSFGLSFDVGKPLKIQPPQGYAAGTLTLGDFSEIVFSDLSIWSKEQYLEHWQASARDALKGGEYNLFCSSLGKKSADIWISFSGDGTFRFYHLMMLMSQIRILDDKLIVSVDPSLEEGEIDFGSRWIVPAPYISCNLK